MIELTTSLLMLASTLSPLAGGAIQTDYGTSSAREAAPVTETISNRHEIATSTLASNSTSTPMSIASTEAYVRAYFKDTPILAEVARCESSFRQFDKDGRVIRGIVNKGDIGVMQINIYYHKTDAEKLGYDLYTLDGNLAFAKWLYGKYGLDPWQSSSGCWQHDRTIAIGSVRG